MKKRDMHITFHNPNNEKDSNKLAVTIISETAPRALARYILEQERQRSIPERTIMKN